MTVKEIKQDHLHLESKKKKKDSPVVKDYTSYLFATEKQLTNIRSKFEELKQSAPPFWVEPYCKIYHVPVEGGTIRVLHIKPENPLSIRPIVFISGWSTMPWLFSDFYEILHNRIEFYFVETREKSSSVIKRRKADMSLGQKAKDVQTVINYFELDKLDFVLFGSCWGAAVIFQGLLDGSLRAPQLVTFSPMHKLWFNKYILKVLVPFLPAFIITILMKIVPFFMFLGMKAKKQKKRMQESFKDAVTWKWKKAAIAATDFELFGKLSKIEEEILIISGTHDRVHDAKNYPKFTDELQNSRFLFFGIDETEREYALGLIVYELSQITSKEYIPEYFKDYEKKIE
ncbi:MAG: alpha/beta hydrolase [Candidatus Heimdallarchaeota archaeon]|nr:alpha/beta hydrolase [Candidatus Heimdallarchaeota archaeon]